MTAPADQQWMQVTVCAPTQVVEAVLRLLREQHGYQDIAPIDWCEMERRQDYSTVTYAPIEPVTTNRYVVDWRDPPAGL